MPKVKESSLKKQRHDPLDRQLHQDKQSAYVQPKASKKRQRHRANSDEEEEESAISDQMGQKILALSREQILEENKSKSKSKSQQRGSSKFRSGPTSNALDDDYVESEDEEDEATYNANMQNTYETFDIHASDEQALENFMSSETPARRTLADIIMEKIREKEANEAAGAAGDVQDMGPPEPVLNPQVVEVYTSVGKLLHRYRAGKVPKAFKVIPSLRNWEEVLYITRPDEWSSQSMRVATRIFASSFNAKMSQRFYAIILLPAVREDIAANKVLNYHLYMSLKKALYKPAAFFKGILLPLIDEGECTLREATIIGSVLAKVSIPVMHSAAAMLKMASMPYSGATSLFLRILIDKKYSLPYRVIDSLVKHFLSFKEETRVLPVLWHQSLLVFAQRYKTTITADQKEQLKLLLRIQNHVKITPEIRRELFSSVSRGEKEKPKHSDDDMMSDI